MSGKGVVKSLKSDKKEKVDAMKGLRKHKKCRGKEFAIRPEPCDVLGCLKGEVWRNFVGKGKVCSCT